MIADAQAQFTLATTLITLLSAASLVLLLKNRQHMVLVALALLAAWAGGYGWATQENWSLFVPDDSTQINYSGYFVGDGSAPASSALWLRYVASSAALMVLVGTFSSPLSWLVAGATGALALPVMYGWSHADSGWLTHSGLLDSGGSLWLFAAAGTAVFACSMWQRRYGSPVPANIVFSEVNARLWAALYLLILSYQMQMNRAIDAVWLAMASGQLLAASVAAAIVALAIARMAKHPAISLSVWHGMVAGLASVAVDVLSFSLPQAALTGVLGCLCAWGTAQAMQRYGHAAAGGIGALMGGGLFGVFSLCAVNPMAAVYSQAIATVAITGFCCTLVIALSALERQFLRLRSRRSQ